VIGAAGGRGGLQRFYFFVIGQRIGWVPIGGGFSGSAE
jgi:hypothetical protein